MVPAGASWKVFNVGQRDRRRDLARLYGSKKRLLTTGIDVESTKTILPLFGIQVSFQFMHPAMLHSNLHQVMFRRKLQYSE